MRHSLIVIDKVNEDGTVNGTWLQDSTGSLVNAIKKARDTEAVNSNKIKIAVTESFLYGSPNYSMRFGLTRLD